MHTLERRRIAFAGWFTAHYFYKLSPGTPDRLRQRMSGAYSLLLNKYWVDEVYDRAFVQSTKAAGRVMDAVDTRVVDGAVVGGHRAAQLRSIWILLHRLASVVQEGVLELGEPFGSDGHQNQDDMHWFGHPSRGGAKTRSH